MADLSGCVSLASNFKLDYCSEQDQIVATVKDGFISTNAMLTKVACGSIDEAMCLATDVAKEGGLQLQQRRLRPRGVWTIHPSHCCTFGHPCVQSLIKYSIRSYQRHVTAGSRLCCKSIKSSSVVRQVVSRMSVNMVAERGVWPPQERTTERTCEQVVDVRMPQVVGQVLEVLKISRQDRDMHGTVEQIPDILVPEMVEQLVKLPETVSDDRIQQRTVEHIAVIPVPQDVKELVEVSEVFPQDRSQQCFLEQINETPDVSLAEKVFERPVTHTQQGVNTHAQHIVNTAEVERPKSSMRQCRKPSSRTRSTR